MNEIFWHFGILAFWHFQVRNKVAIPFLHHVNDLRKERRPDRRLGHDSGRVWNWPLCAYQFGGFVWWICGFSLWDTHTQYSIDFLEMVLHLAVRLHRRYGKIDSVRNPKHTTIHVLRLNVGDEKQRSKIGPIGRTPPARGDVTHPITSTLQYAYYYHTCFVEHTFQNTGNIILYRRTSEKSKRRYGVDDLFPGELRPSGGRPWFEDAKVDGEQKAHRGNLIWPDGYYNTLLCFWSLVLNKRLWFHDWVYHIDWPIQQARSFTYCTPRRLMKM